MSSIALLFQSSIIVVRLLCCNKNSLSLAPTINKQDFLVFFLIDTDPDFFFQTFTVKFAAFVIVLTYWLRGEAPMGNRKAFVISLKCKIFVSPC